MRRERFINCNARNTGAVILLLLFCGQCRLHHTIFESSSTLSSIEGGVKKAHQRVIDGSNKQRIVILAGENK